MLSGKTAERHEKRLANKDQNTQNGSDKHGKIKPKLKKRVRKHML